MSSETERVKRLSQAGRDKRVERMRFPLGDKVALVIQDGQSNGLVFLDELKALKFGTGIIAMVLGFRSSMEGGEEHTHNLLGNSRGIITLLMKEMEKADLLVSVPEVARWPRNTE